MINFEIVNFPKISTNKIYAGVHWATRKKIADKYHELSLCSLKNTYDKCPTIEKFPISIYLTFIFNKYALDVDNCTFMGKCIVDGLKGVLYPDDTLKYISSVCYSGAIDKTVEQKIIVSIEN